jgi:hypothetical protein
VGDQNDGDTVLAVETLEDLQNLDAGLGIEVTRRLVGEQNRRLVDESASDGDALPLTARELIRPMLDAVTELDALESFRRALSALVSADTGVDQRQLDVMERGRAGEQVERLKNESDLAIPDASQLVLVLVGDQLARQPILTGVRRVRQPIRFISVDLPEPDGPMMATYSLRRIAMSTPRRACTTSPPMS